MEVLSRDNNVFSAGVLATCFGLLGFLWFVIAHFYKYDLGYAKLIQIKQRRKLKRQGINGPRPSFLHGNAPELQKIIAQSMELKLNQNPKGEFTHDYVPANFPYFHQWAKEYGKVYTYTERNKQHMYIGSAELVREMNTIISAETLGRPTYMINQLIPLLGNGVINSNGHLWSLQRKIVTPEFFNDKIKGMAGLMTDASEVVIRKWKAVINAAGGDDVEVQVDEDLRGFSADVIARACFGSSYAKGKDIFSKLRAVQKLLATPDYMFKSYSSERAREIKRMQKEVDDLIWDTVQERAKQGSADKDLLQSLLDNNPLDVDKRKDIIIDNCKSIYFAGHETTAVSSSWCLVLFSLYPEWQRRVRQEVLEVFNASPTFESLNKMKWLNMFVQEVLRLYSPGAIVNREVLKDVKIGELVIPKGVLMWVLTPALHRDPEMWGPDVNEFKPERFAEGVSNACKVPQAYLPFGIGSRYCLGKNFALLELKLILCHILSNFSFSLSPKYQHSPSFVMILEPAHGVHLLMNKIG